MLDVYKTSNLATWLTVRPTLKVTSTLLELSAMVYVGGVVEGSCNIHPLPESTYTLKVLEASVASAYNIIVSNKVWLAVGIIHWVPELLKKAYKAPGATGSPLTS